MSANVGKRHEKAGSRWVKVMLIMLVIFVGYNFIDAEVYMFSKLFQWFCGLFNCMYTHAYINIYNSNNNYYYV